LCDGVAVKYDDSHDDVDFVCLFGQWEGCSYCRLAYSIVVIFRIICIVTPVVVVIITFFIAIVI